MRKFSARWWATERLTQWRYAVVFGSPWHYIGYGYLTIAQMDELSGLR